MERERAEKRAARLSQESGADEDGSRKSGKHKKKKKKKKAKIATESHNQMITDSGYMAIEDGHEEDETDEEHEGEETEDEHGNIVERKSTVAFMFDEDEEESEDLEAKFSSIDFYESAEQIEEFERSQQAAI